MPTLAPSNKGPGGFTLIEMLVVLTIIGLIAVAAAQTIGRRPAGLARHEAQAKIEAAIHAARREAGRTGAAQAVDPAAILAGATLKTAIPTAGAGRLIIYPDGSSNGGTIAVEGRTLAEVDWLTAQVRDAS